jgi:hypothetical protein
MKTNEAKCKICGKEATQVLKRERMIYKYNGEDVLVTEWIPYKYNKNPVNKQNTKDTEYYCNKHLKRIY